MNYIICPVRNNLELTKKAVRTFRAQDIGDVEIVVVNNDSTDGTMQWLDGQDDLIVIHFTPPMSVAFSWNRALEFVFKEGAKYALVVNNDVELRPDTYRLLVEDGGEFVTAVGVRDKKKIEPRAWENKPPDIQDYPFQPYPKPDPKAKRPHPDFSCFLIRKSLYEKVGPFDENFKIAFCEDGDYDLRMYTAGVRAYCIDLPYLHHGSMTVKNAEVEEVRRIQAQAEKNREYFYKKHGVHMGSEAYYKRLDKAGPPSSQGGTVGARPTLILTERT